MPTMTKQGAPNQTLSPWLVLPLLLTLNRLCLLGAFEGGRVAAGGDFWAGAMIAKFLIHYGWIPSRLTEIEFPTGIDASKMADFFSEPLVLIWLKLNTLIKPDPVWAIWFGMLTSNVLNIWGTWLILWKRFSTKAPWVAVLAWLMLNLNPWFFARSTRHWQLSWIPLVLWCACLWWDAFTGARPIQKKILFLSYLFLPLQSVYYTFFMGLLWVFGALGFGVRKAFGSKSAPSIKSVARAGSTTLAGVLTGILISIFVMGGPKVFGDAHSNAHRTLHEVNSLTFSARELFRGGPGSLWSEATPRIKETGQVKLSRDKEGFPVPAPKCLLAALLFAALAFSVGRKLISSSGIALLGVSGLLLVGLEEIRFIRDPILFPLFPFIRSYARIFMPLLCIFSLWSAEVMSFFSRLSRKQVGGGLALSAFLLITDYGWINDSYDLSAHEIPNQAEVLWVKAESNPLFLNLSFPLPDGAKSKPLRWYEIYVLTGVPILPGPGTPLKPESDSCKEWLHKLTLAVAAAPAVTWWFEGTKADWDTNRSCLTGLKVEVLSSEQDPGVTRQEHLRIFARVAR